MIILECDPDEFLILRLGFPRGKVKHVAGKGKVLEHVRRSDSKTVGIIDEDPQSTRCQDMNNYEVRETSENLTLMVRKDDAHKSLIQISEYLEHWLIARAKANHINPEDYGLPRDPRRLHDIPRIERDRKFQDFVARLIEVDTEAQTLRRWISDAIK